MSIEIASYRLIEKLSEHTSYWMYRGQRLQDKEAVLLKVLRRPNPAPEHLLPFWQEYEILQGFDLTGVVKVYALENHQQWWIIVLEDFGGRPLDHLGICGCMEPEEYLNLALQLAEIVGELHARQLVHKNISPSNIFYNPSNRQAKLANFESASLVSREKAPLQNPFTLAEFLAYVSPEMTGRMNRSVDYRTDYYSLGATLYELLTGSPPFSGNTPLELVHAHLATLPDPPDPGLEAWRASLPAFQILSSILLKLLAKNPEDRYQTASALRADLQYCLAALQNPDKEGSASSAFIPGQGDRRVDLNIPQLVIGREQEAQALQQAFLRTVSGPAELVLVSGEAGVGKTTLVNQLIRPVTERKGLFLYGKFEQDHALAKYRALGQVLEEFSRLVLSEPGASLRDWRQRVQAALEVNGQLLIDICPQLEKVIGPQPPPEPVDESFARARLHQVVIRFLQAVCQPEHPVLVFLDDLQWLSPDSLLLWQSILSSPGIENLLIVGAYRDNETNPVERIQRLTEEARAAQRGVTQLPLQNLAWSQIYRLVEAALASNQDDVSELTNLVYRRTEGNPFFSNEFLNKLYEDRLLAFHLDDQKWHWDTNRIEAYEVASNVVEFLIRRVENLDRETQNVLQLSACIGRRFDTATLLDLAGEEQASSLASSLWKAVAESLIQPLDDNYGLLAARTLKGVRGESEEFLPSLVELLEGQILFEFRHDRIQQAVLAMLDEGQLKKNNLQIGWLLLEKAERAGEDAVREALFTIVDHLNRGRTLIENPAEMIKAGQLNLTASNQARAIAAFEAASSYLSAGMQFLPPDSWQHQYALTLEIYTAAAEIALLNGDLARAEELAVLAVENASAPLEKARLIKIRMDICIIRTELDQVIDLGIEVIKMLGFNLELSQPPVLIPEQAMRLPPMTEPRALAVSRLDELFIAAGYASSDPRLEQIVLFYIDLFSRFGNPPTASYMYVSYAVILQLSRFEQMEQGCQLGKMALELAEREGPSRTLYAVRYVYYGFVHHWWKPARECIRPLYESFQPAVDAGSLWYSISMQDLAAEVSLFVGNRLEQVRSEQAEALSRVEVFKQMGYTQRLRMWSQVVLNLMGDTPHPQEINGDLFTEDEARQLVDAGQNFQYMFYLYAGRAFLSLLFRNPQQALESSAAAEPLKTSAQNYLIYPLHILTYALALLSVDPAGQLEKVEEHLHLMRLWASLVPENFLHQLELVEAEKARCLGLDELAAESYDRSIHDARKNGYIHESGLAAELAAEFYLDRDDISAAIEHLVTAYYCYLAWGAKTKVDDLVKRYPNWLPPGGDASKQVSSSPSAEVRPTEKLVSSIDLNSILKASLELAQETNLTALLCKLMSFLIENAGAQNGSLILWRDDRWVLEVQSSTELEPDFAILSLPLEDQHTLAGGPRVPVSIINYVINSQAELVLQDASSSHQFSQDAYIQNKQPKSILCAPLLNQGVLSGVIYLENNLVTGAMTSDRLKVVQLISGQAAVSIEKARLYEHLEGLVAERTRELTEANRRLKEEIDERTQVQEALRLSENRYRRVVENTGTGIAVVDEEAYITFTNEEFSRLSGYSHFALRKHFNFMSVVAPADAVRVSELLQARLENSSRVSNSFEFQLVDSSGVEKAVLGTITLLPGSRITILSLIDISARKRAEQGLRESEERLRSITENVPDFIAELDPSNRFLYVNRPPAGYLREEVVGQSLFDVIPEGYHAEVRDLLELTASSGRLQAAEFKQTFPDGTDRWQSVRFAPVIAHGSVGQIVLIGTDVTVQKLIEEQLREVEEFRRATLNSLSEHIAILDEEGQILWVNQAWERFSEANGGDPAKTGVGVNYLQVCEGAVGPEAKFGEKFAGGIRAALSGELETFELEYVCNSEEDMRWFIGRVSTFFMGDSRRVVVAHHEVTQVKQYERALQKSETLYRAIVNTQTEMVCRYLPDTNLTFVNEAYSRSMGKPAEALVGQSFLNSIPPEFHEDIRKTVIEMVKHPGTQEFEQKVFSAGELRWQRWVNSPILQDGKVVEFQAVGIDITERKRMELLLQENEARLRLAMDSAQQAPFDYNLLTGELVWDPRAKVLWGVPTGELPGFDETYQMVHPEDRERIGLALERATDPAGTGDLALEFRVVWPDGSVHWLAAKGRVSFVVEDEQPQPARLLGILRDITERKVAALRLQSTLEELQEAEEELTAQNEELATALSNLEEAHKLLGAERQRYRNLFDFAPDAYLVTSLEGKISEANDAAYNLLGSKDGELTGKPLLGFVHPRDRKAFRSAFNSLVALQQNYFVSGNYREWEIRLRQHGRSYFDASITVTTVPGSKGEPASLRWLVRDISTRKKVQRALHESEERLRIALDSAQLAPFNLNLRTGKMIWDERLTSLLGEIQDGETLSFVEMLQSVHPDDRQLVEQIIARASNGGLDDFEQEFRIVWPDGAVRWIAAKGKVSSGGEGAQRREARLVGILRDITRQKAAEEAHRYNEALLGQVLKNLPVGVWVMDKTGRIVSVNPEGQKIWSGVKYLRLEEYGEYRGWRLESGEPLRPHEWAGVLAITEGKTTLNEELEIEAFDGTHRFILNSAIPLITQEDGLVGAIAVNQDITRQKLEEQELQKASEHLATLLQISQSIASTLDLDGLLKLAIEQLERILPYDVAAILILEQNFLEFRVVRGPAIFDNLLHQKLPVNELTLKDRFVEQGEEIYFPDLNDQEHLFKQLEDIMKIPYPQFAPIRSILGVPLIVRKDLIGVLVVAHFQPNHYPLQPRILANLFANQVAIAIHNAQLYGRAQDLAALEERNRLARELHDSVAQALYSINLFTDATLMAWETNKPDVVQDNLGELADLSRQAMADMRLLIFELRPPALEEVGLVAALQSRLNAVETRTGMQAVIQFEGALHLSAEEEDQLYRITQEALNNVIKHAHANQVKVELMGEAGCIRLVIEDDGIGFDPVVDSQAGGHGIRNIHERAEKIGARCSIDSAPGQGTTITIEVNK